MSETSVGAPAQTASPWETVDLYRFFAFALGQPGRKRYDALFSLAGDECLQDLWTELGCEGDFPGFAWFENYDEYESTYIALFDVGSPEPPFALFESAHYKAIPAQETVLENTMFYDVLGLKCDQAKGSPDYLITQLEFLSAVQFAAQNSSDPAPLLNMEYDFISRHLLNWVPTVQKKLTEAAEDRFAILIRLLSQYLESRRTGQN